MPLCKVVLNMNQTKIKFKAYCLCTIPSFIQINFTFWAPLFAHAHTNEWLHEHDGSSSQDATNSDNYRFLECDPMSSLYHSQENVKSNHN